MQPFRSSALRSINFVFLCASVSLIFLYFFIFVTSISKYFSPFDNIEESSYTYTSAFNYLKFGPANSLLLQDFSSSPFPEDHPYVYNHMPPGPDLLMAGMLRLTNLDIATSRSWLAALVLFGIAIYLATAFLFLERFRSNFAGICLFVVAPGMMALLGRVVYAFTPFLTFFPILMYLIYLRWPRKIYFYVALVTISISAFYIEYSFLSAVLFSWVMLFLTGLLPITRKQIIAICIAFAFGIFLHLVQNFMFLGGRLALKELIFTLSNRITGTPSQSELHAFYETLGIVHHGAHPIVPGVLATVLFTNLSIPGFAKAVEVVIYLAMWAYCAVWAKSGGSVSLALRGAASELKVPANFLLWLIVTVFAPIFLFPAFAQEVNLSGGGANLFFFGIFTAMVTARGLSVVVNEAQRFYFGAKAYASGIVIPSRGYLSEVIWPQFPMLAVRAFLVLGIAITLVQTTSSYVIVAASQLRDVLNFVIASDHQKSLYAIERFHGGSFMTNINSPTVGFLTRQPGYGVCGPNAIGSDGEIRLADCKISFMRRLKYWEKQRPGFFFYFVRPDLFPGFADCMPKAMEIASGNRDDADCMDVLLRRLSANFPLLMSNDVVRVFDLGGIGEVSIAATDNGYGREGTVDHWWYWVRKSIAFTTEDSDAIHRQREVSFDFQLLPDQELNLEIIGDNGHAVRKQVPRPVSGSGHFNVTLPTSFGPIRRVSLSANGEEMHPGPGDPRVVRFLISDLKITLFPPGRIEITATNSEYPREGSDEHWWYWVRERIALTVADSDGGDLPHSLSFDYELLSADNLNVEIVGDNEQIRRQIQKPAAGAGHFSMTLPASFGRVRSVNVSADGNERQLGPNDARMARFRIADLKVAIVSAAGPKAK